jgi:probable phosphoglycerate mutase
VQVEEISITFVRHGQSLSNLAQRWQGQGDSPLSELGRRQAELLGGRLRGRSFTRVISSDLSRAVDTARATGLAFEIDAAFREFDVGCWEGLTREEAMERYPEEFERLKRGEDIPLGGAESYTAFAARIDAALAALYAQLAPGDAALVVCHGGVIATALAGALGLRRGGQWALARVGNTSVTQLSLSCSTSGSMPLAGSAGRALLRVFNDTLHLRQLGEWPLHADAQAMVGLVCGALQRDCYGEFAARYDAAQLAPAGAADVQALCAQLLELHERHPEHRVALATPAASIQAWAEWALWRGALGSAAVAAPDAGSISHVGRVGDRPVLLDYGVAAALEG